MKTIKNKWLPGTFTFTSLLFSFFLIILLNTSCQKDELPEPVSFTNDTQQEGMMKLGKKLVNPYTVENMRKAYENLVNRGILKSGIVIDATHLYIRFLPASEQEMDEFENTLLNYLTEDDIELLEEQYSGHFFDYPLHYEILEGGTYYYDPQLPPGGITWQYTVVPVSFTIPRVHFEVIDPLYLNGAVPEVAHKSGDGLGLDEWYLLENEALILAGDPGAEPVLQSGLKSSRWRPSGTITVWDDVLARQIPLQGAKVRARRWFTVFVGITNADGNYIVNGTLGLRWEANYSIKWERRYWDIREGPWGQALFNGPKQIGAWNLNISSGKSLRYATIHRAAFLYYYNNPLGIKTPPQDTWYKRRLKIGYFHRTADNPSVGGRAFYYQWPTLPQIKIYGAGNDGWRNTLGIFAFTIHELAHASHWDLIGRLDFHYKQNIVVESWASGVEWGLTQTKQAGYSPFYHGEYTGVVEDMVDEIVGHWSYDQVEGYTMHQIEQSLKGAMTWTQWKNNLKNKYNNETENQLDNLFAYWSN